LPCFAIAPDKLVGWTRALRPNEAQFLPERYARLPELGRLTGRGNTANVEVVLQAKPDLIVDVGTTSASLASLAAQVQAQTGIRCHIEATPVTIRALGRLMGNEREAEALAGWYDNELAQAKKLLSINVEVLELLGARNVAAEARAGLVTVPLEQVLVWDPEVILTTDPNFAQLALSDPRWRSVSAVERRRVHLAPHLPFGWFDFPPGANRLLGIWWAGKLLYPEAFDINLRAKVAEFHRRFYHREPTPAQLDSLLAQ
jgi:iron complex transport system substrate-binding protein